MEYLMIEVFVLHTWKSASISRIFQVEIKTDFTFI